MDKVNIYRPLAGDPEQRLDVRDVAALLRRSVSGIWAATKAGDFPQPERHGNRCTRWRWGDILDHLNAIRGETCQR